MLTMLFTEHSSHNPYRLFSDAYETFFAGLDAMEERLEQQRFLFEIT